jgi:hypothetical protein
MYNPHTYSRVIRRRRILSMADITFISNVVTHRSTIYLDELQHELWEKRQVYATTPTLYRALRSLQLTRKKISYLGGGGIALLNLLHHLFVVL